MRVVGLMSAQGAMPEVSWYREAPQRMCFGGDRHRRRGSLSGDTEFMADRKPGDLPEPLLGAGKVLQTASGLHVVFHEMPEDDNRGAGWAAAMSRVGLPEWSRAEPARPRW